MQPAMRMLNKLLNAYKPPWWYSMEKQGYECSFCGIMVAQRSKFDEPGEHRDGCTYIEAVQFAVKAAERDEARWER